MKKVWAWIKLQWSKFVVALKEYTWKIKPVTKGLDGLNSSTDRLWLMTPALFARGHKFVNQVDIGFVWFGFGLKLQVTKKIK